MCLAQSTNLEQLRSGVCRLRVLSMQKMDVSSQSSVPKSCLTSLVHLIAHFLIALRDFINRTRSNLAALPLSITFVFCRRSSPTETHARQDRTSSSDTTEDWCELYVSYERARAQAADASSFSLSTAVARRSVLSSSPPVTLAIGSGHLTSLSAPWTATVASRRCFANSTCLHSDDRHTPSRSSSSTHPSPSSSQLNSTSPSSTDTSKLPKSAADYLLSQAALEEEADFLAAQQRKPVPAELREEAWDGDEPQYRAIRRILEDQYQPLRIKVRRVAFLILKAAAHLPMFSLPLHRASKRRSPLQHLYPTTCSTRIDPLLLPLPRPRHHSSPGKSSFVLQQGTVHPPRNPQQPPPLYHYPPLVASRHGNVSPTRTNARSIIELVTVSITVQKELESWCLTKKEDHRMTVRLEDRRVRSGGRWEV